MKNLRNIIGLLLALLTVNLNAEGQEKEKRTASGISYTIFTANAGQKIKLNDIITFNFVQKTDKDSVLLSSYDMGQPVKVQVTASRNIADLMDFFPLLAAKDSAVVKVPSDSIFKNSESERPPFLPKGSSLVFTIKIEKVQSLEEVMAEQKQAMEKLQAEEMAQLQKYVETEKLKPQVTASGLRYVITKASVKNKPVSGDTVMVNYTGRTLEGKVFDSSVEAEAKKAGLEQPGRKYEPISFVLGKGEVIEGWDEGLALLNEGSKATFLIPSQLAYGPRGAGDAIKPFTTLVFDVELVKVKAVKKAAAPPATKKAPAKSVPAKKPATPAKKPVSTKKH